MLVLTQLHTNEFCPSQQSSKGSGRLLCGGGSIATRLAGKAENKVAEELKTRISKFGFKSRSWNEQSMNVFQKGKRKRLSSKEI
ncbi:hypothetical protein L596_014380 [Steinernema carpocapsae]|uniref:Uncharacterized protein n=1 Tax=Steinernema carpocapsae TaxID=34508 RepID=A0A4U5NCP3_STECR|nr:hypothetical protein L596_014380 [Steinernema carpocapsae]